MTSDLIELDGVTRRFGDVTALDDVTLHVPPGRVVGLLGPNGAGKTTLLELVTGLRRPTAGHVRLFGADPRDPATRRELGVTPQETALPELLRVGEAVDFIAQHFDDPIPRAELLERFGLQELARRQIGALSGGQQRRLAVAVALLGRPRLVLLDEPTTGLDVDARHTLWQALRDYRSDGGTILLTSHYIEEIEELAQRVVVLDHGRVLADDTLPAILSRVATRRVCVRAPALPDLPGVVRDTLDGDRHTLYTGDADQLIRDLVTSGAAFSDIEVRGASLEEAFLAMTESHTPKAGVR